MTLTKHFKIISLLATLVLSTLPPPPEATAYKYDLGQTDLSQNSVLKSFHTQFPKTGNRNIHPHSRQIV